MQNVEKQISVCDGLDSLQLLLLWLVPDTQVGWEGCDGKQNRGDFAGTCEEVEDGVPLFDRGLLLVQDLLEFFDSLFCTDSSLSGNSG